MLFCRASFLLQENGEIKWEIPAEVDKSFPLFQCDCYEVVNTFVGVCIQMGAVSGHMFEFWVDRPIPRDIMLLTFEGWCMIQCQQVVSNENSLDFPFSFLPAFAESYFSDLKIKCGESQSQNIECVKSGRDAYGFSESFEKEVSKYQSLEIEIHAMLSQAHAMVSQAMLFFKYLSK